MERAAQLGFAEEQEVAKELLAKLAEKSLDMRIGIRRTVLGDTTAFPVAAEPDPE